MSQAAFCVIYTCLALPTGWLGPLLAGCLAFGAATVALGEVVVPVVPLYVVVLAVLALVLALRLLPARRETATGDAAPPPQWDLPARMVVATGFLVVLTGAAPALGPHLTGLLAPFPLYASILAVFAHRLRGPAAAAGVLRGLLMGLFSFATFFLAVALGVVPLGIGPAFAIAIAAALALQACTLWAMRSAPA